MMFAKICTLYYLAQLSAAQLKIAAFADMSGKNKAFGTQIQNGVAQAVEDINTAGGILGQNLNLSIGDDQSSSKQVSAQANKLVKDGVKFIVGSSSSDSTIKSSEIFAKGGVLQISPGATSPKVTERGLWNIFRTCGRDDRLAEVAGSYIALHYKGKNVAIIHDNSIYGRSVADEVGKAMQGLNYTATMNEEITTGQKDFSKVIAKIKSANIDLVYFGGQITEAGLLRKQMTDKGVLAVMFAGDELASSEFADTAGLAAEGTLIIIPPDQRKSKSAKQAVAAFKKKSIDPEGFTLYSYAAVEVIKQAAETAKSTDPKKIADVIRSGQTFQTVIGKITYDKNGDIIGPDYALYVWKKGKDGRIDYRNNEVTA